MDNFLSETINCQNLDMFMRYFETINRNVLRSVSVSLGDGSFSCPAASPPLSPSQMFVRGCLVPCLAVQSSVAY